MAPPVAGVGEIQKPQLSHTAYRSAAYDPREPRTPMVRSAIDANTTTTFFIVLSITDTGRGSKDVNGNL